MESSGNLRVCVVCGSKISFRDVFPYLKKRKVVGDILSGIYDKYDITFLPNINSLFDFSLDDTITRNYIYSFDYDYLLFVFDEHYFKRDLNLLLQVLLVTNKVYVYVLDSFFKDNYIQYDLLSKILNVPILKDEKIKNFPDYDFSNYRFSFGIIEDELSYLDFITENRGVSIKCLCLGYSDDMILNYRIKNVLDSFYKKGIKNDDISSIILEIISSKCDSILDKVYVYDNASYSFLDKIFMGKVSGKIVMVLLLFLIFFITISLANYPSTLLYNFFSSFNDDLLNFFSFLGEGVSNCLVYGVYRILTWTVSVMLPPMAIFFPLFALLEESGYLPRVAFNLDNIFRKCGSCGRQALTMMMGFGCNAVGVTGSRDIGFQREKLISILTNSLVPCNGRFPILIAVITMFMFSGIMGSLILTMFIILSVLFTFLLSKILSVTILKGESSSFSLELSPYRRPRFLRTIVNSFFSKTIFVLRRAVFVSIPFGFIIYLVSNVYVSGESILSICASFLDPFGKMIGLDGVILMAFILGFPANEIVIPIMIMGYMSLGYIEDFSSLNNLKDLFINNGWTFCTAICMIVFTLVHFPCFTTVLTIRKESSLKWALLSILIPLVCGIVLCFLITRVYYLIF